MLRLLLLFSLSLLVAGEYIERRCVVWYGTERNLKFNNGTHCGTDETDAVPCTHSVHTLVAPETWNIGDVKDWTITGCGGDAVCKDREGKNIEERCQLEQNCPYSSKFSDYNKDPHARSGWCVDDRFWITPSAGEIIFWIVVGLIIIVFICVYCMTLEPTPGIGNYEGSRKKYKWTGGPGLFTRRKKPIVTPMTNIKF